MVSKVKNIVFVHDKKTMVYHLAWEPYINTLPLRCDGDMRRLWGKKEEEGRDQEGHDEKSRHRKRSGDESSDPFSPNLQQKENPM